MKILLCVHQFLPDFQAGTEVLTFGTARALQRCGHQVTILTGYPERRPLEDSQRLDSYQYEGIEVERFRHARVPMGGQANVVEAEYNNKFLALHFRGLVEKLQPDIVHFFHLGRLSASIVDVCHDLGIPMVLTPTDFWFICPTCRLQLPDNSLCTGPDKSGVNCLRHVVSNTQPSELTAKLNILPDWLVALAIWGINQGLLSKRWFSPYVRALSARPAFLRPRINMMDAVVVPTRLMENLLCRNGLVAEKIIFSPYGLDMSSISPSPSKKGGHPALRLGFIGSLYEHKGAHLLIEAVRSLPAALPLVVRIYGSMDEFPEYAEKLRTAAAGDARISFCGTFPNSEIGQVLADLDVLAVPSIWYENTPLVIYSAHAAGCPVIATNLGGMAEVVRDGENGLLIEAGHVGGLTQAIRRLAEDRELLRRLADKIKPPKSIADYAGELVVIYQKILHKRQTA